MNSKERIDFIYEALSELLYYIDPLNAVTIEMQDAYGACISFNEDDSTESKLKQLITERNFTFLDSEESVIYSKDIEKFGASVVFSKSKSNPKINLSVTV